MSEFFFQLYSSNFRKNNAMSNSTEKIQQWLQTHGTTAAKTIAGNQKIFFLTTLLAVGASAFAITVSSIAINMYNSCKDFGSSNVKGSQAFFISMLVISILVLLGAVAGALVYFRYGRKLAAKEQ